MKKYDIVIIGGGPAGVTCALSAKNTYPNKSIALIRKDPEPMIPCGIPYTIHTLASIDDNILPDAPLKNKDIRIINDEVVGKNDTILTLLKNDDIQYERLVLATGSNAVIPAIDGADKEGVFSVKKDKGYLKNFKAKVQEAENIVILGGGYIGIETADELLKAGKKITLVESRFTLLPTMDEEFGHKVRELIESRGASVITGKSITAAVGDNRISSVRLDDGTLLNCDLLIVSCGYVPNTGLARTMDINYDERKGILVDDYLRTSDKGVFAIGDCAAKYDYFTGELSNIMLASTAMAEGRLVGSNLYSIKVIRKYQGVLGTFSTKIGDTAFAVSGITEKRAKERKLDYTTGTAKAFDRHPGKIPGASEMQVKLLFSTYSHHLLGAQVSGGDSTGEMINLLSVMILNKMTDMDIDTLQIGTHPLLTASPIAYPIINATVDAIEKWYHYQPV